MEFIWKVSSGTTLHIPDRPLAINIAISYPDIKTDQLHLSSAMLNIAFLQQLRNHKPVPIQLKSLEWPIQESTILFRGSPVPARVSLRGPCIQRKAPRLALCCQAGERWGSRKGQKSQKPFHIRGTPMLTWRARGRCQQWWSRCVVCDYAMLHPLLPGGGKEAEEWSPQLSSDTARNYCQMVPKPISYEQVLSDTVFALLAPIPAEAFEKYCAISKRMHSFGLSF